MTGAELVLGLQLVAASTAIIDKSIKFYNDIKYRKQNRQIAMQKRNLWSYIFGVKEDLTGIKKDFSDLKELVVDIKDTIEFESYRIINKIEKDRMEDLISRIKSLSFSLKIGNQQTILNYLIHVNESVDYAKNRLGEGKKEWLLPFIAGQSVLITTYGLLEHNTSGLNNEMNRILNKLRHEIIDQYVKILVKKNRGIPWMEIHKILTNKPSNTDYLVRLIPNEDYDINGHWTMKEEYDNGTTTGGVVFIRPDGDNYYGNFILTNYNGDGTTIIVQQHVNIFVQGSKVTMEAYEYKRISGEVNTYYLDSWEGKFINSRLITGFSKDTYGHTGKFKMTL